MLQRKIKNKLDKTCSINKICLDNNNKCRVLRVYILVIIIDKLSSVFLYLYFIYIHIILIIF